MQDANPLPDEAGEGRDPRELDPAYIKDVDRSTGEVIWKKIIALFVARRSRESGDVLGARFLLESDGRNPTYPNLKIYELEPQSRFAGAKARYERSYGVMAYHDPSPIADLDGTDWNDFEVTAFANVFQNIRVANNQVSMPKAQAQAIIRLKYRHDGIAENWYHNSAVERRFGYIAVRDAVKELRAKTLQHAPIMPQRRRGVTEYMTRPISE
jgi:hypothetical protein